MIEVRHLSKSFNHHKVLDRVTLTIQTGETTVIIGRSGSGKSVLLKHMIGLMTPDEGAVLVGGVDVSALKGAELDKLRMKFGMLFQSAALFDSTTAFENVAFPLIEHTTMSPQAIPQRVHECLHLVGLENVDRLYP